MDKVFVIGIGGTGMRCLESFVHLCAMGMFDDTQVEMLALDTDRDNGNFRRLSELVDAYRGAKGVNKEHHAYANSFFTAKINFYQYSPDYSRQENSSFARLTHYDDLRYKQREQADLADLLLTKNTREFDLKHGYRAQTSLGSVLMYHDIIDEVGRNPDSDLRKFISDLITAGTTKVFVLGSVFGGTGASSIPVLPKAFAEAAKIIAPGSSLKDIYFGAVVLTSYFSFVAPSNDYVKRQRIVATAEKFALNSQAALMFYNEDNTVKRVYQKFYMLGTPSIEFQTSQGEGETVTGGERQKNDAHYIELFAAFAAYDFFKTPSEELDRIKDDVKGVRYYYRTVGEDSKITFEDLVGEGEDRDKLAHRFGVLVAMSHLVLFSEFYRSAKMGDLQRNNIEGYEDIDPKEVDSIEKYLQYFNFFIKDGNIVDGWLRQLYHSAGGGDRFLFLPDMFGTSSEKELGKFKYNAKLYQKDFDSHHYGTGFLAGNPFDLFKSTFVKKTENNPNVANRCEQLTQRMFATLTTLYQFK